MAVALRSGISHEVWLEDARALITAVELYGEADRKRR